MTRHVAIFTFPHHGHIYPTLGLCSELVNRGYRVSYPTVEYFADHIRQTGSEPIIFSPYELEGGEKIFRFTGFPDAKFWKLFSSLVMPQMTHLAAGTLFELERFYAGDVPDLIIYDLLSFAGWVLARRFKVPAIQHWAHFAHQSSLIREYGVCYNPEPMVTFSTLLDLFLSAHGVEVKNSLWHKEDLYISFVAKEFQFDAAAFDERFCFVGPGLYRPPRAKFEIKNEGRPVLLVSESSASDRETTFVSICADAFADSKYHVIFSVGNGPKRMIDPLPRNFQLNVSSAYNTEILPYVSLTICQAGMGITQESLSNGVPVLGVPLSPYQAEVSYRVAELGLGLQLLECDMTPDTLRESVDKILGNGRISDNLRHMQQRLRDSGGAKMAVDRIESFLTAKQNLT